MKIKAKRLTRGILTVLCGWLVMFGSCSMEIDSERQSGGSAAIKKIDALLNRSAFAKMAFMGGSVLYSPNDANANQLSKGVIVATRLGSIEKIDLGGGNFSYKNSSSNYTLGYIVISDISKESVSFSYNVFSQDKSVKNASPAGNFTINAGGSVDLNGDGILDIAYTKPPAGRKGRKSNMWLTFLCDASVGMNAVMFSIIPMQYSRSAYPNGMMGINTSGQYIIHKYDAGTSSRSAVSNIAYGDYVFDMKENMISRYVGEERNGRSARAIEDSELSLVESISSDDSPESYEFKGNEFTEDFVIDELLAAMPASIVQENFGGRSISENVDYLNRLVREPSFIDKLLQANQGEVADEIRLQLSEAPVSGEVEQVLFGRHSLALLYPDFCPDVNLFSTSLSVILPYFFVDLGELKDDEQIQKESEENVNGRFIMPGRMTKKWQEHYNCYYRYGQFLKNYESRELDLRELNENALWYKYVLILEDLEWTPGDEILRRIAEANADEMTLNALKTVRDYRIDQEAQKKAAAEEKERIRKESMANFQENAEKKIDESLSTMNERYEEYVRQRNEMESKFSELVAINLAPILAGITGQQWLVDIVEGSSSTFSIGVGGKISFANMQPDINLKLGIYLKFELLNNLAVTIDETSIFAKEQPKKINYDERLAEFKETFGGGEDITTEDVQIYFQKYRDEKVMSDLGINRWYFKLTKADDKVSENGAIRPSSSAKGLHKSFQPLRQLPFVITLDGLFDVLISTQAVAEFKNVFVGASFMRMLDLKAGIDWGFRKYFKIFGAKIPRPDTAYFKPYTDVNTYSGQAFFAGIITKDKNQMYAGGGIQFIFSPVIELRVGAGVGCDGFGVATADLTLGVAGDFYTPLSVYLGLATNYGGEPMFITETALDAGFALRTDLQFYLKAPLIGARRWSWDFPKLNFNKNMQLFRLRLENGKITKLEGPQL